MVIGLRAVVRKGGGPRGFCMLVLLALLSGLLVPACNPRGTEARAGEILAAPAPIPSAVDTSPDRPELENYLAAADRLTLRFRGYPELSGDYRISPDRVISVPVIGRVSVAGLDLAGLEKLLSDKLTRIVQKDAFATAEIAAYRPVFVTGAVKNSGAVEWRPDLTVLQAVALVGGMVSQSAPGALPGATSNPVALKKAIDSQMRDLATIARIEAERAAATSIEIPPELVDLVGKDEAGRLVAEQNAVLENNRSSMAGKLETLQSGIDAGLAEMASLRAQIDKLNGQLQIRADYRQKVQQLFDKGIITAERNLAEEIKVNDLEEKITNINVGLAKAAGTVAELKLAVVALKRDREAALDEELARMQRDSAQLAIEIGANRATRPEAVIKASSQGRNDLQPTFQIVRQENGASVNLSATPGTLLRPGDVLVVGAP